MEGASLKTVDQQIQDHEGQLARLLDLYLEGGFPKDVLGERKLRLEEMLVSLRRERGDLASHIRTVTLSDDPLGAVEDFCATIRKGLDRADFDARRRIIELLDVRGKIAVENGQKVLYLKCLVSHLEQQPLSPMPISPSSNSDWRNPVELIARHVIISDKMRKPSDQMGVAS